jgi:hypothetical protein
MPLVGISSSNTRRQYFVSEVKFGNSSALRIERDIEEDYGPMTEWITRSCQGLKITVCGKT